jgi:CubicO group peptidase (beta-lactamase class C family)
MTDGGLSKTRLGRMGEVMGGYAGRGEVPGVVTLVARRGEVHVETAGTVAAGGSAPVTRGTLFRVTSMTKPITAAAAMILVEECKLRLDEPVDRLLPELSGRQVLRRLDGPVADTVPANRPITVRDLLTFTMGGYGGILAPPGTYPIQDALEVLSLALPDPPGPDEWIRRLGTLPLIHQPGEKWMYSTGADVLGVLIARACGQPFGTFLRERLFEPLGMTDTGFAVPAAKLGRLAAGYWPDPATGALAPDPRPRDSWNRPPAFPSGAGDPQAGLICTVDDYLAFAQMLLGGGKHRGQRVLSRPTVETMTTDQLTPAQKAVSGFWPGYFDNRGWGFGVSVVTRRDHPAAPVGTYGWDGGWGTIWRSDPREDMITILMTQVAWTSPNPPNICLDFWTTAYQAIDD